MVFPYDQEDKKDRMPEKRRPDARTRRALLVQRLAHEEARAAEKRGQQEHTANVMLHTAALLQEAAKALQPSNAATRRSPEDEPDSSPRSSVDGYPRQTSTKRTFSADDPVNDLSADSWQSSRSVFKGCLQENGGSLACSWKERSPR